MKKLAFESEFEEVNFEYKGETVVEVCRAVSRELKSRFPDILQLYIFFLDQPQLL